MIRPLCLFFFFHERHEDCLVCRKYEGNIVVYKGVWGVNSARNSERSDVYVDELAETIRMLNPCSGVFVETDIVFWLCWTIPWHEPLQIWWKLPRTHGFLLALFPGGRIWKHFWWGSCGGRDWILADTLPKTHNYTLKMIRLMEEIPSNQVIS